MATGTWSSSARSDSQSAIGRARVGSVSWLMRILGASLLASLLLVAALLLSRRWLFVEFQPPNPWAVLALAGVLAVVAVFTRTALVDSFDPATGVRMPVAFLRPLVLAMVAAAVSVRGAHVVPLIALWATVFAASRRELQLAEEWLAARWGRWTQAPESTSQEVQERVLESGASTVSTIGEDSCAERDAVRNETADPAHPSVNEGDASREFAARTMATDQASLPWTAATSQQWSRGTEESGTEYCSGRVRLAVVRGQRVVNWHAVLCPAFGSPPEIEVEVVDGPEAECSVTEILRHGWRVELKLPRAADRDTEIQLEFYAWEVVESEGQAEAA